MISLRVRISYLVATQYTTYLYKKIIFYTIMYFSETNLPYHRWTLMAYIVCHPLEMCLHVPQFLQLSRCLRVNVLLTQNPLKISKHHMKTCTTLIIWQNFYYIKQTKFNNKCGSYLTENILTVWAITIPLAFAFRCQVLGYEMQNQSQ